MGKKPKQDPAVMLLKACLKACNKLLFHFHKISPPNAHLFNNNIGPTGLFFIYFFHFHVSCYRLQGGKKSLAINRFSRDLMTSEEGKVMQLHH